jgi:trimethylamine corrinoid protein
MNSINARAKEAVMKYDIDESKKIAHEAVKNKIDLVELIQSGYTSGINEVGKLFDEKKLFLPHIMAAANTMNAALEILSPELERQGVSSGEGLGTFVICTIEGDIHSIGKDIVAIMLKIAGFNIINIGRDVPLDTIVKACTDNKARLVGTSALMTSTMTNQKLLEEKLRAAGIRDNIITNVGGAPVTQDWADEIGADIYTENASDAVVKMTRAVKD